MTQPWRTHDDPAEQARSLGVERLVYRLKWGNAKLTKEMNRVASAEKFIDNVVAAIKELDTPRLLAHGPGDSGDGYTKNPARAIRGEPEAISETELAELAKTNNQKDTDRRVATHEWRQTLTIEERLHLCRRQAETQRVPVKPQLIAIERLVERIEKRLDRV